MVVGPNDFSFFPKAKPAVAKTHPKGYWQRADVCRQFFEEIANSKGFDPIGQSDQWPTIKTADIVSKKVFLIAPD